MYILLIILNVNGQFNSFTDVNFQEFSSQSLCVVAKQELQNLATGAIGELKLKCVKK